MTRLEIFSVLTRVFRDVFDDDSVTPRENMTAAEVDGWDIFSHIRLVVAVEEAIGVRFETREKSTSLRMSGDFADLIARKVKSSR